jgi:hypothetical protein
MMRDVGGSIAETWTADRPEECPWHSSPTRAVSGRGVIIGWSGSLRNSESVMRMMLLPVPQDC